MRNNNKQQIYGLNKQINKINKYLFFINIKTYISCVINIFSTFNFFRGVNIIRVSQEYRMYFLIIFAWFLLQILLGISWTTFTARTSRHGCTIMCVGTMITCWLWFWSQYQFVFYFVQLRYCAFKNSSPTELIFPSHVVSYCKVYAYEINLITYYPIVDVSIVFMSLYLPDWTN